jgi:transposase InsO family protein
MGRVGACGDNAAMESFFALLQKNVLNRKRWETREELAPSGDRDLDREDLPPQTPPSRPRQTYPDRV